jgi:hypothetical protein
MHSELIRGAAVQLHCSMPQPSSTQGAPAMTLHTLNQQIDFLNLQGVQLACLRGGGLFCWQRIRCFENEAMQQAIRSQ